MVASARHIVVKVSEQKLYLYDYSTAVQALKVYDVSTAKNGVGNVLGSKRTPLGKHRIAKKIGSDNQFGEIFVGRVPQNRIAEVYRDETDLAHDLILTRIMWLDGLEEGFNRGGEVDSKRRYIYIHGTDEEGLIGTRASDGCIRMRNDEVIELFDLVQIGTPVSIEM